MYLQGETTKAKHVLQVPDTSKPSAYFETFMFRLQHPLLSSRHPLTFVPYGAYCAKACLQWCPRRCHACRSPEYKVCSGESTVDIVQDMLPAAVKGSLCLQPPLNINNDVFTPGAHTMSCARTDPCMFQTVCFACRPPGRCCSRLVQTQLGPK